MVRSRTACAGRRRRIFLDAEVGRLGLADGARNQNDAFWPIATWLFPPFFGFRHCERSEAIHRLLQKESWIASGVYHRARMRATRWLAMTAVNISQ